LFFDDLIDLLHLLTNLFALAFLCFLGLALLYDPLNGPRLKKEVEPVRNVGLCLLILKDGCAQVLMDGDGARDTQVEGPVDHGLAPNENDVSASEPLEQRPCECSCGDSLWREQVAQSARPRVSEYVKVHILDPVMN